MGIVNHVVVVLVYVIAARSIAHGAFKGGRAVRARHSSRAADARRARILSLEIATGEPLTPESMEWLLAQPVEYISPDRRRNCLGCGIEYSPGAEYLFVYTGPARELNLKSRLCSACYGRAKTVMVS